MNSSGSLEKYLNEIEKFPPLSYADEQELCKQIIQNDDKARNILAKSHLRIVVPIAKKYVDKNPSIDLLALIEEGNKGLFKAVNMFTASKYRFADYAKWWIRQSIISYFKEKQHNQMNRVSLVTKPQKEYELLDSGGGEKLERFGDVVLVRPDPQALWEKKLGDSDWALANGEYERDGKDGKWTGTIPKEWEINFGNLKFLIKPTSFKHVGLFPEQLSNWQWGSELIKNAGREISVLNLFAYTGGATLAAAQAGASVTHVDASKTAIAWARENAKLSELEDKPIKWLVEDVMQYVRREIKRGSKYDAIIMDPPAFGHGPKDELWKIEEQFIELIELCTQLLSEKPLFFLINGYAAGYSSLAFAYNLEPLIKKFGGGVEHGDLTIEDKNRRLLPAGIFARWQA